MIRSKYLGFFILALFMFFSFAPSLAAGEIGVRMKVDGMV